MISSKKVLSIIVILIVVLAGSLFFLNRPLSEGTIIMTRISSAEDISILSQKHLKTANFNSTIVAFNPNKPKHSAKILTGDFYTAHSPELSGDSRQIVFTGKMNPKSNRQIWLMNLNSQRYHALTDESMNCFDPFFLTNERIAFSCDWQHDQYGSGSLLFSMDPDNGKMNRITFHPHADYAGSMLHDGRIMWISQQVYPDTEAKTLMALRPDGTNANLFYQLPADYQIISKARENDDRQIYFAAKNTGSVTGSSLLQFSYINPVTSTQKAYESENGMILSVYPRVDGSLLVAYQNSRSGNAGLYEFNQVNAKMVSLLADEEYHYIEPVVVKGQPFLPKVLPTALNDTMDTGIIVFTDPNLNINQSNHRNLIRVEGLDGIYKEFLTAVDGSFYIIATAKVPIRFSQLNEKGEIINGPYPWTWVMSGDRRGFTGWNPIQMIAPANLVPQAINDPAIQISAPGPVDLPFIVDFNRASEVRDED